MVSKDLTDNNITESEIDAKAQAYFAALYTNKIANGFAVDIHATYTPKNSSGISNVLITGSGTMRTDFMRVAGFPNLNYKSSSTAAWGNTRMRVAMVLDNTGSMAQNGKMAAMQTAAKDMIDTLSSCNKQTGDVYISIIPFTKDVNVGTSNVDAPWINWTEWEAEPPILGTTSPTASRSAVGGSNCPFTNSNQGFTCMDRPATLSGAQAQHDPRSARMQATSAPASTAAINAPAKPGSTTTAATRPRPARPRRKLRIDIARAREAAQADLHFWRGDGTAATATRPPTTAPGPAASTIATRTTTPRTPRRDQAAQPVHEVLRASSGTDCLSATGDSDEQ